MALQFLGKTAIITGGGGALGRSYALEFAKRGCNVIVNDVGSSLSGVAGAASNDPAGKVVQEIISKGGKAIANYDNVVHGERIIESAMKSFGRCDIVINNAGILRDKSLAKMTKEDWRAVLDVHLEGTFSICHAVWPIMQAQKYGRIINVGSGAGLYGNFGQANYSAAKMAILGLTNTLALEGDKHNIKVNCVVPVAGSRMTETVLPPDMLKLLDPHHITPLVTYLAHESSNYTGSCFEVGGGWYSQVRFQRSEGISLAGPNGTPATAEDLQHHMHVVTDFTRENTYPTSPASALREMVVAHEKAAKQGGGSAASAATKASTDATSSATTAAAAGSTSTWPACPSDAIFAKIDQLIKGNPSRAAELAGKMKARVAFSVTSGSTTKHWVLHLKADEEPAVFLLDATQTPKALTEAPNVTLICSDETLLSLSTGDLSPEYAYMRGWLQIKGQMGVAQKVKKLLAEIK